MADAAVEFLLNNLKEVVIQHSRLIKETSGEIESLERDLLVFNAFLKDSVEKRRDAVDERTKVVVKDIREVVYELENIIDSFVNKITAEKNGFAGLVKKLFKNPLDLHAIGQEVAKVRKRVEKARADIGLVSLEDKRKSQQYSQDRPPRKKDVVGFEDVAADLIHLLKRETDYLDVISLIGMLGLGKTTLAWKVFNDPNIVYKFPIRIWLSISQQFSDRDIFLSILKELTTITEDIRSSKDREIADLVIAHLERGSFLIVMDDVWKTDDWRRLDAVLPKNNKGKVLITSRNKDVGKFASRSDSIKNLRYFNENESWQLLRWEALHTLECPPELVNVGQIIAKNCNGLPLAVVIIGGILATKFEDTNISAVEKEWDIVSNGVTTYVSENDPEKRMRKFISLSYDILPYHLRSCFLYLGMFPEDYEIPASKLTRLWIGEGFIIEQSESRSLEEIAEKYLDDLINRNLVKSEKFKYDGKVKTCRIHDTLRDFCRIEAANENLVKEIKYVNDEFRPKISDIDKYRRLAIHSNCLGFIWLEPSCPNARSFVCFSKDKFVVPAEYSPKILAAFKFLKVFDVEPFKFDTVDTDIYQLVNMRYLVLSCNLSILPPKLSQLWNMQTLVVHTMSRTLEVKADIWKMKNLRYFKTNATANLPKPSKSSEHGKQLQTLGTISVESCTPELFKRASNLKKLGIRGNLGFLLNGRSGSFDSLGEMKHIEKLKLINDVYPSPSRESPLPSLPQYDRFPSELMSLTLRATFLKWDAMSTLGLLKKLEVLKLKENAFMGTKWEAVDGGFKCLQLLHIDETDLIMWNASSHHYPKLRTLVLRNCEKLLKIPISMADIPSLQMLELYNCKSAAASAGEIKKAKENTHPKASAFVLSIFPPMNDQF